MAAIILLGYNFLSAYIADKKSNVTAAGLLSSMEESGRQYNGEIPDYILNPEMNMPIKNVNGIDYVGVLSIPELGIDLPVASQWNYRNLLVTPCRYYGSAYLHNMVVCAHNYEAHFGRIKHLNVGDSVIFTDIDGNKFEFRVNELETLQPTAIEEMLSNDYDLTLFTCTLGGMSRVTVRCVQQENWT